MSIYIIQKEVGEYHPNYVVMYASFDIEKIKNKLKEYEEIEALRYNNSNGDEITVFKYNIDEDIYSMNGSGALFAQTKYAIDPNSF